jgi:small-conductance mechanosensitive channel
MTPTPMRGIRVPASYFGAALAAAILLQLSMVPTATFAQDERPEDAAVVQHLNAAITWYKQLSSSNESAGQPSDAFYLENARNLAKQALQLAFQSAEAEAALMATGKGGEGAAVPAQTSNEQQNISKAAANTANLISQTQAQIEAVSQQIEKASGKKRQELTSQRESLQEQLEFNKALQEALQKLTTFMSGNGAASRGLAKEIDDLKNSVPGVFAKIPPKAVPGATAGTPPAAPEGTGLISQTSLLFTRIAGLRDLDQLVGGETRVAAMARQVQTPLRARLRDTVQQGRALSGQPPPQDPAGVEANRRKMTLLTTQFKQIADAAVPLTQELIVLDESQASLRQWQSSIHSGYLRILETVAIRLAFLMGGIIIVLVLSELSQKAIFRYVRDARKRHQLLLVRRIVTVILMAIVLAMGFVSEFASLATFAGFITAGIALALQTVIVSVAAYFFLIGRHGVRVGDRITVSGVTGDVIDVGLVRLSLMELGGAGSDLHLTGRVVVFSNSVIFQAAPFFKQIPGTGYVWHEVVVKLERGADYTLAEGKLLEAVNSVYFQYRESLEQQHQTLEGMFSVPVSAPSPQARLQLGEDRLDLVVRYPVVLRRESEIDDQMAKKVVETIENLPELKAAVGGPTIRPAAKS